MRRGVKCSVDLARYRSSWPDGCRRHPPSPFRDGEPPLFALPGRSGYAHAPTAAFLVPVVLDALRSCPEYKDVVHVVPGEADSFCANRLRTRGGVVLTSDSDLLVHDVGKGRVAFFREIRENEDEGAEDPDSWIFLLFDIPDLLKRMGLSPGIDARRLGYEVWRDSRASFNAIVSSCQKDLILEGDRRGFEEFCREYATPEFPLPLTVGGNKLGITSLDPRVSELVLQLGSPEIGGIDASGARVFLPALSEDALLGSPWTPSTPIRQLAYTIYTWILPKPYLRLVVQEFRRIQTAQQSGRSVVVMQKPAAQDLAKVVLSYMEKLKRIFGHTGKTFWTFLSLAMDIKDCQEYEKRPHCLTILRPSSAHVSSPDSDKFAKIPWGVTHFTGHLQACFYSFRMLHQILCIIPDSELDGLPPQVAQLRNELFNLPGIDDFPDCESSLEFLKTFKETKPLEIINCLIELPRWATSLVTEVKEPKKRKKRKSSEKEVARRRPANPFSVLEDE